MALTQRLLLKLQITPKIIPPPLRILLPDGFTSGTEHSSSPGFVAPSEVCVAPLSLPQALMHSRGSVPSAAGRGRTERPRPPGCSSVTHTWCLGAHPHS